MLFIHLHLTALLLASALTLTLAQSPSSFPAHCLPRMATDPFLDPQSCASALNVFLSSNPDSASLFTSSASSASSTRQLPFDSTYMGCRLRIELLYAGAVNQSAHDVWAQGIALVTTCVVDGEYVGGRVFVNAGGLTVSLRPAGDDDGWESRFNGSSVVVGESGDGGGNAGLTAIAVGSGGPSS